MYIQNTKHKVKDQVKSITGPEPGSGSESGSEARVTISKERKENLFYSTLNIPRKEGGRGGCTGYGDRNRNRNGDWDRDRDGRG